MNQPQDWKADISSSPFGPLGVIAMDVTGFLMIRRITNIDI